MSMGLVWPKSVCRLAATGDPSLVHVAQINGKAKWFYSGRYVCWSRAVNVDGYTFFSHAT